MRRLRAIVLILCALAVRGLWAGETGADEANKALLARCDAALTQGADWLLTQQTETGSFGGPMAETGKAGLALSALLSGSLKGQPQDTAAIKKTAAYLVSMQQPDGALCAPGETGLASYQTSAALSALCTLANPAHRSSREKAREFLVSIQRKSGVDGGGWGYSADKRGDLSNTQYTLEALKAAGLDEKSPAFQNCLAFLQRCQNRSESNDQAWAKNDGGGIYNPAPPDKGGKGKAFGARDPFASYGSMSYALLRCYILVGLPPEDPRVKAVQKWIGENYTVDENPGMGAEQKLQGLFYYYHAMAKALALLGKPTIALSNGTRAPWAKDLAEKILSLQGKDGSWVNTAMRWMENDKVIATSYAMLALSECRQMLARPH